MQSSCGARDTSVPVILREQPRTSQKIALGGRDYLIVGVRSGCLINVDHVVFLPLIVTNFGSYKLSLIISYCYYYVDTLRLGVREIRGFGTRVPVFRAGGPAAVSMVRS